MCDNIAGDMLTVVVIGATGSLARGKIFPSLFALFNDNHLPKNFVIFGFARTALEREKFQEKISENITCRVGSKRCPTEDFLDRCYYVAGKYDSPEDFARLSERAGEVEQCANANRIFYLAIPPSFFVPVAQLVGTKCRPRDGYTRVIVEKPFGHDLESSRELSRALYSSLNEDEIYRIDHYLGKELIENLTVLRFSNLVFQPLWHRHYIRDVQIMLSEDSGTEGRGGYFDAYGIIRDIIQNHLLQVLALFAMEQPISLGSEDIRDEKVKLLRSIRHIDKSNIVLGQYKVCAESFAMMSPFSYGNFLLLPRMNGSSAPSAQGYREQEDVPNGSKTPTFAAMALFIDNTRWEGVPFFIKAGKGLDKRQAQIRVRFQRPPGGLYLNESSSTNSLNELVIQIQPNESIFLVINNKVPGLDLHLERKKLNLRYGGASQTKLPDAYERLLLDAANGDKRLFLRNDELDAAWRLFSPLIHDLELNGGTEPEKYTRGSWGPAAAHYLAAKFDTQWGDVDE